MADFILCRSQDSTALARQLQARLGVLGLTFAVFSKDTSSCLLWRESANEQHESFFRRTEAAWILRSGLFAYQEEAGSAGLSAFLEAFDPERPSLAGTQGQFSLIFKKAEALYLCNDPLGTNKIYHNADLTLFSNLFIAVAEGQPNPSLDLQGCYEYVWNGVPAGEKTFFQEVRTLPHGFVTVLAPREPPLRLPLPALDLDEIQPSPQSLEATASLHLERLRNLMTGYRRAFDSHINLLLSGGYDSRLLLGLLLDAGIRPNITVYGTANDLDCRIAQQIAEGEGLSFRHVDKSKVPPIPREEYRDHLLQNYAAFDGWKVSGLFDNGADIADRAAQVADGSAKMNGSMGEIYRNFFYLSDRSFSARELVWSFYDCNHPGACTARFDLTAYENHLSEEIMKALDVEEQPLDRYQVERVYPLFRGRYWTAREVPINQGFGPYLTPFMEPAVIKGTSEVKIAWKSYGRLEGRMIRQLNPHLAAYPSVYGHGFDADPPLSAILRAQASYLRPPFLRRLSYRLQHRRKSPQPYFLSETYLASVMDSTFPYLRQLFKIERIHDEDAFNRIATIEFLCQQYNAQAI